MKATGRRSARSDRGERGVTIVLMALLSVVLISLAALALGVGFLATEKSRITALGNVASYAAIDHYIQDPNDLADSDETARRQNAVERANFILNQNHMVGADQPLGELYLSGESPPDNNAGVVRFGHYFRELPDDGSNPCGNSSADYPCFLETDSGSANAVRVELKTQDDNQVKSPFFMSAFVGKNEYALHTSATATLVNTCIAHLLDVSTSTVTDSHRPYQKLCASALLGCESIWGDAAIKVEEPSILATDPADPDSTLSFSTASLFAFDATKVFEDPVDFLSDRTYVPASEVANPPSGQLKDCSSGSVLQDNFPHLTYWCSMYPNRAEWEAVNGPAPDTMYFRSDYELQFVFRGKRHSYMLINKYIKRPEPLQSFLQGANLALRLIERMPTEANSGMFWAFTGVVAGRAFPQIPTDIADADIALTQDLGYLTQVTNLPLIGAVDGTGARIGAQQHPNLLDEGFFPMDPVNIKTEAEADYAGANIPYTILQAASWLSNACDASTRKTIFLYTDGMSTCRMDADFSATPPFISNTSCAVTGETPWSNYISSENAMMNGLADLLARQGITVTIFFTGNGVEGNFLNVKDPDITTCNETDNCFLDLNEAYQLGWRGVPKGSSGALPACGSTGVGSLFDCNNYRIKEDGTRETLTSGNEDAFKRVVLSEEGVVFGRPVGVMGELALRTGGVFCPLLPTSTVDKYIDHDGDFEPGEQCPAGTDAECCQLIYDNHDSARGKTPCRLKNSQRAAGSFQREALDYAPMGLQAALCAQRSVEANPYILSEPVKVCLINGNCFQT